MGECSRLNVVSIASQKRAASFSVRSRETERRAEAAGIEPAFSESAGDAEEDADLPRGGDSEEAPEDSHEVAGTAERTDDPELTGDEPPG